METRETEYVEEKINHVFSSFNCAAKDNPANQCILKDLGDEKIRLIYAHKNNTLPD